MQLCIAVVRERAPGESRTALVPETAKKFAALGARLRMEQSAAIQSHFLDQDFPEVTMVTGITEGYTNAGLIMRVAPPSPEEIAAMPEGSVLIGLLKPFEDKERLAALNARKITAFALELLPRISRAQSMDALSSQASCAGYQCGLIAAARCTKFFPMLTTAAGTIRPARVLVIGAGVAGLQAIATCRRLGAMVEAYDVRSAAREQIESLGAKFVDTGVSADGAGGYARELTAEEKAAQAEKLAKAVAQADVGLAQLGAELRRQVGNGRVGKQVDEDAGLERAQVGAADRGGDRRIGVGALHEVVPDRRCPGQAAGSGGHGGDVCGLENEEPGGGRARR